jgi:hypothetical protein
MSHNFSWLLCAVFESSLLLMPLVGTHAATGNLTIYDEALQNGNDCSNTGGQPGFPVRIGYVSIVHSGAKSVAVQNYSGVEFGWCPALTYSINSDYDGIDFWVNGGPDGGESVNLILGAVAGGNPVALASLAELYGSPIPINSWVHIQASFSKPPFAHPSGTSDVASLYFSVYSGNSTNFFILDDLFLTGADIFKNGFDS